MIERDAFQILDLAGRWRFTPEGGEATSIAVPGGGWLKQGFDCEAGTYERDLDIPDPGQPAVYRLELGAVNHHAECWVGPDAPHLVKVHDEVTAFTGQSIDLSPGIQPGGKALLRLSVRAWRGGRPIAPHWAEWCRSIARGIFRSAQLHVLPQTWIEDVWVETSVSEGTALIRATVVHAGATTRRLRLRASMAGADDRAHWPYPHIPELELDLAAGERREVCLGPVRWSAGPESFWRPNLPYQPGYRAQLHWAALELSEGGQRVHAARVRFGFRELRQAGDHFELNHVRVNFRGDNLQVANYDRIDHHGRGDAIDTLPGFLPPTADCAGWPGAVDHFLRLNYNVQRQHMGPWSPYMLDVCDELGLMLIGESASRWNGFDMEDGRGFHEVKCLQDIIRRDRHHPSIVRWSSKNEAQCPDPAYHVELYVAIRALDTTRPIYEDILVGDRVGFDPHKVLAPLLDKPDFTWIEHYLAFDDGGRPYFTTINHSDAVVPLVGRPYGMGEANWMRSSTPAGLPWFAATIALARAQGASDVRPYVLVSSWASSVPGVKHTDLITEENRHPVYGEDNLPEPWAHAGIQLLQAACHPLLALDVDFWKRNRSCDAHGHFPIHAPILTAKAEVVRTITVFNDEFAGTDLELRWELREGHPGNRARERGSLPLSIALGTGAAATVAFTAPMFNTFVFLILEVHKAGALRFSDALTCFEVVGGEDFKSEFNGEERKFM